MSVGQENLSNAPIPRMCSKLGHIHATTICPNSGRIITTAICPKLEQIHPIGILEKRIELNTLLRADNLA